MKKIHFGLLSLFLVFTFLWPAQRPRVREAGIEPGVFTPGKWNAITDVKGVRVGHVTLIEGDNIRTGVTAVLPHGGNIFQDKVPAAVYAANGFGKLTGWTQVEELGSLETPVVLTNTLSVPAAADAVIDYMLSYPGNERVFSVNPVVGETNDGYLNDIRGRHVTKKHVLSAIEKAASGPVEEGCVGAGTGTSCFGFKGGIGTSSRKLPASLGGYTVGVLVQTNHGGVLNINGFPAGEELGNYAYKRFLDAEEEGSCMVVVATDAPLLARNLKRLAKRALLGIARTGGYYSNGSGDYAVAFSTAEEVRIPYRPEGALETYEVVPDRMMSPLFLAAAEACEEAILNSLFKAEAMKGKDGHSEEALPVAKILEMMRNYRFFR
ncbi:MAG TPA: S58 family peptidase [Candidatus Aminicenantes bacterium]|nr:S58 family peptidase [Candidatus Aminicenantes bacterium]